VAIPTRLARPSEPTRSANPIEALGSASESTELQAPALPNTVYAAFAGLIDQNSLNRIFAGVGGATQRGVSEIHILFESTGGAVGDGIALYNFFRGVPITVNLYNAGTVASIAVLAFLGAAHRYVSQHATFAIHKSRYPAQTPTDTSGHRALSDSLIIEDRRSEAIIRAHTIIPNRLWRLHARQDVTFQAQEAVQFGIAEAIREFQIPKGNQLFNI
jgi:ATP-dependent protease ClpP protease subunit